MNTRLACVGVLMAAACGAVFAQTAPGSGPAPSTASGPAYPTKTVRWIVPMPPGGGTDMISRTVTAKLSELWGD